MLALTMPLPTGIDPRSLQLRSSENTHLRYETGEAHGLGVHFRLELASAFPKDDLSSPEFDMQLLWHLLATTALLSFIHVG